MFTQVRDGDLLCSTSISTALQFQYPDNIRFSLLMPVSVTRELKTACRVDFLTLNTFLVMATLLMSLGMLMGAPVGETEI